MKRVKCSKTLSAFVFHPSEPRTSQKRSRSSRSGIEMLLSLHILHRDQMLVFSGVTAVLLAGCYAHTIPAAHGQPGTANLTFYIHLAAVVSQVTFLLANLGRVSCKLLPVSSYSHIGSKQEREMEREGKYMKVLGLSYCFEE